MREIEVKARVKSIEDVIAQLEAHGAKVNDVVHQRDEVFGLPGVAGDDSNSEPWLRIRTETKNNEKTYTFTLKKSITNQLDSIEHETAVVDADELRQIILHSGFVPYSDITKTRRKAKIGDVEICLDSVESLGEFVEAEKMTNEEADYEVVVSELWQTLREIGVDRSSEVTDGYDVMMKRLEGAA